MRIRKETENINWRVFARAYALTALFYALLLLVNLWQFDSILPSAWLNLVVYPVLFGIIYANARRGARLVVSDPRSCHDFKQELLQKLAREGYALEHTAGESVARPTSGYYKWAERWFGTERITICWGEEITIAGSQHRISWMEDVLTWNPAFRYGLSTN